MQLKASTALLAQLVQVLLKPRHDCDDVERRVECTPATMTHRLNNVSSKGVSSSLQTQLMFSSGLALTSPGNANFWFLRSVYGSVTEPGWVAPVRCQIHSAV